MHKASPLCFGLFLNTLTLNLTLHSEVLLALILKWPESTVPSDALPRLEVLYPGKHVKVSCRVLLNHILHIIRPQSFLELFFVETEL